MHKNNSECNINIFCYVCGKLVSLPTRNEISTEIEQIYGLYFNMRLIRNVDWAPNIVCTTCNTKLFSWFEEKSDQMPFGVPMLWSNPQSHSVEDCYGCANHTHIFNRRQCRITDYKSVNSAQTPLLHSDSIPAPKRPNPTEKHASVPDSSASLPQPVANGCNHIEINQERFNMIERQLKLSERQAIILSKHFKSLKILALGVKVLGFRKRQQELLDFFNVNEENTFAYCSNIAGLMGFMNIEYKSEDWRLFIDLSKRSLKAVLISVTNKTKTSVPIAMTSNIKESYESMKMILDAVKYQAHVWQICTDLNVISLLTGAYSAYTKIMCFDCVWNYRFHWNQYQERNWMPQTEFRRKHARIIHEALVPIEKIFLPALHLKLGLVKSFIKVLSPKAVDHLMLIFPRLYAGKIKEGLSISICYCTK